MGVVHRGDNPGERPFQLRLLLPHPTQAQAEEWLKRFEERLGAKLDPPRAALAKKLRFASFSELEQFGLDVQRRYVLALPESNIKRIVGDCLAQWEERFMAPEGKDGRRHA